MRVAYFLSCGLVMAVLGPTFLLSLPKTDSLLLSVTDNGDQDLKRTELAKRSIRHHPKTGLLLLFAIYLYPVNLFDSDLIQAKDWVQWHCSIPSAEEETSRSGVRRRRISLLFPIRRWQLGF